MKKFLSLFLGALLFLAGTVCTNAIEEKPAQITFIYINGSNNLAYNNRLKFKTEFVESVKKLHPQIKTRFEKDELIKEIFLKGEKFTINPEPITFYWGDKSLKVVEALDNDLKSAKKYSPIIAHQAKTIFAHCLHDAVWVQKNHNMAKVLDDLHKVVKSEVSKGNKVVLLGYSAGSFVTYQYYMNKAEAIVLKDITWRDFDEELKSFIAKNPVKPTCFDALIETDLVRYNTQTGKYDPNKNLEVFKKNYAELDKYTEQACFSNGTVKGIVGFASPARLFYSDVLAPETSISHISKLMAKSIVENDVFYLTVNYSNDPFGFSNAENFTLKQLGLTSNNKEKASKGFIYNKSNNYVPRTFITSHLAYWQTPKRFAKAIVKAFNEGYPHFYGLDK